MRTSFSIIMAAALSLCLFGVGSDVADSALMDTAQSDIIDQTENAGQSDSGEADHVSVSGSEESEADSEKSDGIVTEAKTPDPDIKQAIDRIVKSGAVYATASADAKETAPECEAAESAVVVPEIYAENEETVMPEITYGAEGITQTEFPLTRDADAVAGGLTDDSTVTVYDHDTGNCSQITLREYVIGVVAAEMPASFGEEALKAQAIAARTYAVYKLCRGGVEAHPEAAICNSPSHCCAFIPESKAAEKWGDAATDVLSTAERAVRNTENVVIIYEEDSICAAWHSSSDGYTKNASDVWGGHVAYLCSVPTVEDRHDSGHGVGMSQYGAKEMAESGASASDILTHYYTGSEVVRVE